MNRHLYIIQSKQSGAIKIGISKNPKKRLAQLQTGSPFKLKLILIIENRADLEKRLHKELSCFRIRNYKGEWFSYDSLPSLPDWIYEKLNLEIVDSWWK